MLNIVHKERKKRKKRKGERRVRKDKEKTEVRDGKNVKKVSCKWAKGTVIKQRGQKKRKNLYLKVHKNENFFGFDFEFCTISLLVMSKC